MTKAIQETDRLKMPAGNLWLFSKQCSSSRKANTRSLRPTRVVMATRARFTALDYMTTTAFWASRVNSICLRPRVRDEEAICKYVGCDFHPSFQVIAQLDKETGELCYIDHLYAGS